MTANSRDWTAATIDPQTAWYVGLPGECLAAAEALAAEVRPEATTDLRLPAALRPALAASLAPARQALESGRGFVVLPGLEVERLGNTVSRAVYWLVGQGLGEPFTQNVQGTLLYDVRDTGQSVAEGARFSVTNAESTVHTDNSFGGEVLDYVGLLCLRTARHGGRSQVVNGFAVLDVLRREDLRALELLEQPFHVDRRGGTRPGEETTVRRPVVEWKDGEPLIRYLRTWIEAGHEKAGQPLTPEQVAALDRLDAVLRRPDLRIEFDLNPGDMFFSNNRWTLHNRTAFEDYPEPERRRHLVRLWLRARP